MVKIEPVIKSDEEESKKEHKVKAAEERERVTHFLRNVRQHGKSGKGLRASGAEADKTYPVLIVRGGGDVLDHGRQVEEREFVDGKVPVLGAIGREEEVLAAVPITTTIPQPNVKSGIRQD